MAASLGAAISSGGAWILGVVNESAAAVAVATAAVYYVVYELLTRRRELESERRDAELAAAPERPSPTGR